MRFFDSLYGEIDLVGDLFKKCVDSSNIQRLRDVRQIDVSNHFATGIANLSRFEHSIGTAYLATLNYESNSDIYDGLGITKEELSISALLHDVANGPFGHTFEKSMSISGYIPENEVVNVISGIYDCNTRFFDKINTLGEVLTGGQKARIIEVYTNSYVSKMISNSIDLDNIDNVFRVALHVGIPFDKSIPKRLGSSLSYEDGELKVLDEELPLFTEWLRVRGEVYRLLFYDLFGFSLRCMLYECMESLVINDKLKQLCRSGFNLLSVLTDFETLLQIKETGKGLCAYGTVTQVPLPDLVDRIVNGRMYSCVLVMDSDDVVSGAYIENHRSEIMYQISKELGGITRDYNVHLHVLVDNGNTSREVKYKGGVLGRCSKKTVVGVFIDDGYGEIVPVNDLIIAGSVAERRLRMWSHTLSRVTTFSKDGDISFMELDM